VKYTPTTRQEMPGRSKPTPEARRESMDRAKWKARSWNWRWGIPFMVVAIIIGALVGWGIDKVFANVP